MPTPAEPLRADAQRNRARILAAAAQVFATRGLAATLHDVAAHAGVGVGTVYRRFPDKQTLIEAMFAQAIDDIVATAERAAAIDDPWQALSVLLHDMTASAAADTGLRQLLIDQVGPERFAAARERLASVLRGLLVRAREQGVVRPDLEGPDIALLWRALVHIAEQTRNVREDVWRRHLEIVLDGLRARPGQRPLSVPPLTRAEADAVLPGQR